MRTLLLLLLFLPTSLFARDVELEQLARMFEGSFMSARPTAADPKHPLELRMHVRRIWSERTDGYWFYVEQAAAATQDIPLLQRFHHLLRRADRRLVSEVFTVAEPLRFARAWYDTSLIATLTPDSLTHRPGCDVVLTKKAEGFAGATAGRDCASDLPDGRYATSQLTLSTGELQLWARGYDASGTGSSGAAGGPYVLVKLDAADPGSLGRLLSEAIASSRRFEFDVALALLDSAATIDPHNADIGTLRASMLRYLDREGDGVEAARAAIAIAPCHSYAHSVLGDLLNPQYSSYEGADADSAWAHYLTAVRCDSTEGNAWMGIWIEAMRRGDDAMRHRSLVALRTSGFMTPAALESARWYLRDLPRNAVLVTGGDMDTYPLVVVQETEGYRADVAVVNASLLSLPWYARFMRDRHGVDVVFDDAQLDALEYVQDGETSRSPGRQIIDAWREQIRGRSISRPVVLCITYAPSDGEPPLGGFGRNAGTHMLPSDVQIDDTAAIARRLVHVDGRRFRGAFTSGRDMSPIRRTAEPGAATVARLAGALAYSQLAAGDRDAARATTAWLRAFISDAALEGWDAALGELEESIAE